MRRVGGEVLSAPSPRSTLQKFLLVALWFLPALYAGWLVVELARSEPMTPLRWAVTPAFVTLWFIAWIAFLKGEQAGRA